MKGKVAKVRFSNKDSTKRDHAAKLNREKAMERMQHSVPETARKNFNRKPYQTGGKEHECNS